MHHLIPRFSGRDAYVADVVEHILTQQPTRLVILGPGGVGKTSVAAAVFHHHQIESHFGVNRMFSSCEALTSAQSLVDALRIAFQFDTRRDKSLDTLKKLLASVPDTLLVVDNFETLWDVVEGKHEIRKLLGTLAGESL